MIALGSNYRGTMGLHPNNRLVTHGPYRFVRHPMNAVFPLVSIVLLLLSANWVIGIGALVLIGTMSIVRAPIEERQLIERFGEEVLTLFDEIHTEGSTLIVVTHEASVAQRAQRVIRLLDGRIVADQRENPRPEEAHLLPGSDESGGKGT